MVMHWLLFAFYCTGSGCPHESHAEARTCASGGEGRRQPGTLLLGRANDTCSQRHRNGGRGGAGAGAGGSGGWRCTFRLFRPPHASQGIGDLVRQASCGPAYRGWRGCGTSHGPAGPASCLLYTVTGGTCHDTEGMAQLVDQSKNDLGTFAISMLSHVYSPALDAAGGAALAGTPAAPCLSLGVASLSMAAAC